jgi:hypothetical protein
MVLDAGWGVAKHHIMRDGTIAWMAKVSWGKLCLKWSKNGENGTGGVQPTTGCVAIPLSLLQASISVPSLSTIIDIL